MFKNLDIYTQRYLQISVAYMLFVAIEQGFNLPHASWIVITGCMIYVGFNPGTVLKRSYLRLPGTFIGICAMSIMFYIIHFDYRTAILFMVFIAWAMVYCFAMRYNYYIIVTTLFSDIGIEWSNSSSFAMQYYIVDRTIYTILVFAICILLEHFWFGNSNFTVINYSRRKKNLLKEALSIAANAESNRFTASGVFRLIGSTRASWNQLKPLLNDAIYERNKEILTDDLQYKISKVFRGVVCLWYLHSQSNGKQLPEKLQLLNQRIVDDLNNTYKELCDENN